MFEFVTNYQHRLLNCLKRFYSTPTTNINTIQSQLRLQQIERHIAAGGSVFKQADGTWTLMGETETRDTDSNNNSKQYTIDELNCNLNKLQSLNFYVNALPGHTPTDATQSQYNIPNVCYTLCKPSPFNSETRLISVSFLTAKLLNLTLPTTDIETQQYAQYFSGNTVLPQCTHSYAQRYGGYQFGAWAGQLGDGRAHSLLQTYNSNNELYELQLKGSGRTVFSRGFDGRSTLRSSIREYLMSEHMRALHIPTTYALTLCVSGDKIRRTAAEQCAVVCRVAPTYIRFGTFEIHYKTNEFQLIQQLADYVIQYFYPDIDTQYPVDSSVNALSDTKPLSARYAALLEQITYRTATLIAHWQSVYFIHSVMNTDNMSIIGVTLDYAPPSLLCDEFKLSYVSNDTDDTAMYSYEHQPTAAKWNLDKLGECFTVLCNSRDINNAISQFDTIYNNKYIELMKHKLGLQQQCETDRELIQALITALRYTSNVDYTYFFRHCFNSFRIDDTSYTDVLNHSGVNVDYHSGVMEWCQQYSKRLQLEKYANDNERHTYCNKYNPKYILRAYILDQAYEQAKNNDYTIINELLDCMTHPYDDNVKYDKWSQRPPEFYNNLTCSCSS